MANLDTLVDELSKLTVLEAADLAKKLEETWGVSAAAPVAIAVGAAAGAGEAAEAAVEAHSVASLNTQISGAILDPSHGDLVKAARVLASRRFEIVQLDGRFVGRTRIDSDGLRAQPLVVGDWLYVYGNSGKLVALTIK